VKRSSRTPSSLRSRRCRQWSWIYLTAVVLWGAGELAIRFSDVDGAYGRSLLNLLYRDGVGSERGRVARTPWIV
jgi:hypothetical protein